jgi:hypothetical protein
MIHGIVANETMTSVKKMFSAGFCKKPNPATPAALLHDGVYHSYKNQSTSF